MSDYDQGRKDENDFWGSYFAWQTKLSVAALVLLVLWGMAKGWF